MTFKKTSERVDLGSLISSHAPESFPQRSNASMYCSSQITGKYSEGEVGGACWVIKSPLTMKKKSGNPAVWRGDRFIVTVFD